MTAKGIGCLVLGGVGVVLGLILFFASTVFIGTGERAVMTRFGRVTGQELDEGFHFKSPLDRANKYEVKEQRTDAKAESASKDLQDVHADLVLNHALEPGQVAEIHQKLGPDYEQKVVEPAIQEVFKATTARYTARELIQNRAQVKLTSEDLLRRRLSPYGIRVVTLSLTNFGFSAEFTAAIEAKQVAEQEAEKARFSLEKSKLEAEAQRIQGATLTQQFLFSKFLEEWDGHLPRVMTGENDLFSFLLEDLSQEVQ